MRRAGAYALVAAVVAAGCNGVIGDPGGLPSPGGPLGGPAPPGAPSCRADDPPTAGATPMRRLTRDEYDNTVRDLLGATQAPALDFVADEAYGGFASNNATPVSTRAVEQYLDAANALAAAAPVRDLAACGADEPEADCARRFIASFGRRALRRPLEAAESQGLLALYTDKRTRGGDVESALRLVVEALLASPSFLYRPEPGAAPAGGDPAAARPLTAFELATRLAYTLWASTPDDALLDAAATGALDSRAGLEAQARRMLAAPRAGDAIRSFYRQWLGLTALELASRDAARFPEFTPALRDAMVQETLTFTEQHLRAGDRAFRTLIAGAYTFVNAPLASLYGIAPPPGSDTGFVRVALPADQRAGVLTHASVLTANSDPSQGSPVLRGKFVRQRLLCDSIPPPPPSANTNLPAPDPHTSIRQRYSQHATDPACGACHQRMDPIGFGLLHFDAIGRWRERDGDGPVDARGQIVGADDADGAFDGATELAARLANSARAQQCYGTQWLRFALGRSDGAEDRCSVAAIGQRVVASGGDVREAILAVVTSDAFRLIRPATAP